MKRRLSVVWMGILVGLVGFPPLGVWAAPGAGMAPFEVAQRFRGVGMRGALEGMRERHPERSREQLPQARQLTQQDAGEWRQAWQGVSPADQATLRQAESSAIEHIKGLTPAQRQQLRQAAERGVQEFKQLPPEQQAQLHQQFVQSARAYTALTAEQKQSFLSDVAHSIDQTSTISPEQRVRLKEQYRKLLGQ